jgi:phosphoglycolate phosphatase-like HAD superfamily hydrolase
LPNGLPAVVTRQAPYTAPVTPLAAVLFDLDGTLVDTLPVCYVAFRGAVIAAGGRTLSDAEIHALFGPSEDGMMRRVLPHGWTQAIERYFEEYERLLPTCPAIGAEIATALTLLRERAVRTGLVTGKSRTTAMMSVRHFRLDESFDAVETGAPEGVVKAEAIRRLLEGWRLAPERAVYVGDAASDMRAAREAGCGAVGAAWAFGSRADEVKAAGADRVFTDAGEFLAWLEAASRPPSG